VLAPDGAGEPTVYSFIKKHAKSANGRRGIEEARRQVNPLTRDELMRIVNVWADAALHLTERDLRMMERLVQAQNRTVELEIVPSTVTRLQRAIWQVPRQPRLQFVSGLTSRSHRTRRAHALFLGVARAPKAPAS